NRTSKSGVASKFVMQAAPLVPSRSARQLLSTSRPTGVSRPKPVTTTRWPRSVRVRILQLQTGPSTAPPLLNSFFLEVADRIADRLQVLGILVRDLDPELLLEGHH